jgi:hypothetical protein
MPLRTQPGPSFYAEWIALLCGLLALPALLGRQGLYIPRIALLPLGLAALLSLQLLWLPAVLRSGALTALLYLLWAFLLMLVTAGLLRSMALDKLARWLAGALVVAASLNACNLMLFHSGVRADLSWLFLRPDRGANLGQVNLLADLLWLGIASLLYRWQRSTRHAYVWMLPLALLLLASALTGGRAPMLYACWLVLAACVFGTPRLRKAALWTALIYFASVGLVHVLPLMSYPGSDSLSRLIGDGRAATAGTSSGSLRIDLAILAGQLAWAHPLTGAGWGSFAWESYTRASEANILLAGAEHAHQLFFQLAAELGLLAPVLVAAALALWAWPLWAARRQLRTQAEYWWALAAVGVILLHAQLEYPLWYAHLLGVCAILLVCAEQKVYALPRWQVSRGLVGVVMATGGYLLASSLFDYARLESWLQMDRRRTGTSVAEGHYQVLADLQQGSLLQAPAARMLAAVMPPTIEHLDGKRLLCAQALLSEPQSPAVFTCAVLDALAGEAGLAEQRWQLAVLAFGPDLPPYLKQLEARLSAAEMQALPPWVFAPQQP